MNYRISKLHKIFNNGFFILIIMSSIITPIYNSEYNERYEQQSNYSHLEFNQVTIEQPELAVQTIIFPSESMLEDGQSVDLEAVIVNGDDQDYIGLELQVALTDNNAIAHAGPPKPVLYHTSIGVVPALSTSSEFITIDVKYGIFTMEVSLTSNGTVLPNSVFKMTIQVISKPIGDVLSVFVTVVFILITILSILALPTIMAYMKKD